jgi:predicted aspartyl protease
VHRRPRCTDQSIEGVFLDQGLSLAVASPLAVLIDLVVSDSLCTHSMSLSACKLDSSGVSPVISTTSTSASEMNIENTVPSFLNSVIISETKEVKSHFHISCYLKGRHRTVKVAAMVDSGATALFINKKYAESQKMWQVPLEHSIRLHIISMERSMKPVVSPIK